MSFVRSNIASHGLRLMFLSLSVSLSFAFPLILCLFRFSALFSCVRFSFSQGYSACSATDFSFYALFLRQWFGFFYDMFSGLFSKQAFCSPCCCSRYPLKSIFSILRSNEVIFQWPLSLCSMLNMFQCLRYDILMLWLKLCEFPPFLSFFPFVIVICFSIEQWLHCLFQRNRNSEDRDERCEISMFWHRKKGVGMK